MDRAQLTVEDKIFLMGLAAPSMPFFRFASDVQLFVGSEINRLDQKQKLLAAKERKERKEKGNG